jgi:hypothetical protein
MSRNPVERVVVIRLWSETIDDAHSAWRGTLHVLGQGTPRPFHSRADLLTSLRTLIPDDSASATTDDAPEQNNRFGETCENT